MRPPQNAGEDCANSLRSAPPPSGFNEAPAERGGRLEPLRPGRAVVDASMRPPQNAGEDTARASRLGGGPDRFNEAPAERGGKTRASAPWPAGAPSLQ